MARLTLRFKEKKIQDYELSTGQHMTIGRNQDNDIVIDNPAVSGHHARIESVASSFIVRDLNSTNGVFVNKQQIETHVLHHEDIILIGKHELVFDVIDILDASGNAGPVNKNQPAHEEFAEDKTRLLDTREYREIIQQANGKVTSDASGSTVQGKKENNMGLFSKLWKKSSGNKKK